MNLEIDSQSIHPCFFVLLFGCVELSKENSTVRSNISDDLSQSKYVKL
jgi:hypothetical protein